MLSPDWIRHPDEAVWLRDHPDAFGEAVALVQPFLQWCIRRAGLTRRPVPMASGLSSWMEEAQVGLWLALASYDPQRAVPTTWCTILVPRHLRRVAQWDRSRDPEHATDPAIIDKMVAVVERGHEAAEALVDLLAAVDWLAPDDATVFAALAGGASVAQAARLVDRSETQVRRRLKALGPQVLARLT